MNAILLLLLLSLYFFFSHKIIKFYYKGLKFLAFILHKTNIKHYWIATENTAI